MGGPVLIVLDLDSTVISSLRPHVKQPQDLKGYPMEDEFIVYERPGLQPFLDFLFSKFKVAVWTAASKGYALFIVEKILLAQPGRKLEFVLHDYHGDISEAIGKCPKDLEMIWGNFPGYTSENTIIIDDFHEVYGPQMCNSYPIPAFEADSTSAMSDRELEKLRKKLEKVVPGPCLTDPLLTEMTLEKAIRKMEASA